jgi:TRAP-type uncharacterized transport system fused permease subunit
MQSWKYTLPAFLLPFMFVLSPDGVGLLLKLPPGGTWLDVAWITLTAVIGIVALAGGVQGWFLRKALLLERLMLVAAGLMLVYPLPIFDVFGIGLMIAVIAAQKLRAT